MLRGKSVHLKHKPPSGNAWVVPQAPHSLPALKKVPLSLQRRMSQGHPIYQCNWTLPSQTSWWKSGAKYIWNKKVGNWVQDCTASNGQSLKAGLIYANMPEIRRRFEALGIAKLDWSLTKIIFFMVHLVLPISECDGNTARTALPSQSSILYSQAVPQRKSRSEWSRKKHNTLALSPSETLFFLSLVCHLKVFYTHFILRELLLRIISQRGPKSETRFEKFIHVGVDAPSLLQESVEAIYLCKPKRKGREDKRERSSPAEGRASNTLGRAEQHQHWWGTMD